MPSHLHVHQISTGRDEVIASWPDRHVEAPNWTSDGDWLVVNCGGRLYRLPAAGGDLELIETGKLRDLNNDHVLAPDGSAVFVSNNDGHLYAASLAGGAVRRVTNDHGPGVQHYLHGVSPDGTELAYVRVASRDGVPYADRNVWTIPVAGGPDRAVTQGPAPADGPEYTPDGTWIYFNSEAAATSAGHAQIFRVRPDGSELTQLTGDERVNWFPHVAPDGRSVLYLSFPPGTTGHPGGLPVRLMIMDIDGADPRELVRLFGGQGTINVNSWAPDSDRFAYMSYDEEEDGGGSTSDGQRVVA